MKRFRQGSLVDDYGDPVDHAWDAMQREIQTNGYGVLTFPRPAPSQPADVMGEGSQDATGPRGCGADGSAP